MPFAIVMLSSPQMKLSFQSLVRVVATLFLAAGMGARVQAGGSSAEAAYAPVSPKPTAATGGLSPLQAELLRRYDTNHDGRLDEEELAAAHAEMLEGQIQTGGVLAHRLYGRLLQSFDRDGDGKLNPAEQATAVAYLKEHNPIIYERLVQRFDRDGDGKLDEPERAALFQTLVRLSAAKKLAGK
jgi:Ca2+-binding EF-hand superfamily protein